jgi:hypothetical protein
VTCAPGVLWQDSGMFQYRIWHHDIRGGLGLALAHPLYHYIGIAIKGIPLGEFGYRVNLISVFCGAITVANIFLCLLFLVEKKFPALIGALSLGFSWTLWQHCVIAEVYTLYTALFSLELVFLVLYYKTVKSKYLFLLMFVNGLSIANHMWGILPCGCYLLWAFYLLFQRQLSVKPMICAFLCWLLGLLPYAWLICEHYSTTQNIMLTLRSALFGDGYSDNVLNVKMTLRIVLENLVFIGYNFATPNILLIGLGAICLKKQVSQNWQWLLFLAITGLFLIFAFRYTVLDRYAFFIPFYVCCGVLIGVGAKRFLEIFQAKYVLVLLLLLTALPVLAYGTAPRVAEAKKITLGTKREIPFRNNYTYFLSPWQANNTGPEKFSRAALNSVENDGVILADGTTVYALWYMQAIKGLKPDVQVVSSHGGYHSPFPMPDPHALETILKTKKVYVVSPVKEYCPEYILESYTFSKAGPLFEINNK